MTTFWVAYLCRAVFFTTVVALLLAGLLSSMRTGSPKLHRFACVLILSQGWLAFLPACHIALPRPLIPSVADTVGLTTVELNSPPLTSLSSPSQSVTLSRDKTDLAWGWALPLVWFLPPLMWVGIKSYRYVQLVFTVPLGQRPAKDWEDEWNHVRQSCGTTHRSQLRITDRMGPLLCFVPFVYLVLVPRELWSSLRSRQRETVLWHEALHIMRHDLWKSLGIRLLALPQWFNPVAWWAVRRFDDAGEWACDDEVTSRLPASRRADYLTALLDTADGDFGKPTGVLAAVGGTNVSKRIKRLVNMDGKEESRMKRRITLLLFAPIAMCAFVRLDAYAEAEIDQNEQSPTANATVSFGSPSKVGTPPAEERYRLAPPDVLVIQSDRLVPKTPYRLQPSDFIQVQITAPEAGLDRPIASSFHVNDQGTVTFSPSFGSVNVRHLTIKEAEAAIARQLSQRIANPHVSVNLLQTSGAQQVSGEHLIGPGGHVNLGVYGSVYVAGMNVEQARAAIEKQLAKHLDKPEVSVDVLTYNNRFFYVITEGDGFGDNVVRIPITGNETVLDAVAQVGGLQQISGKRIWISRPAPQKKSPGSDQILPVDWTAITRGASTATNYQLLPGDRVFVSSLPAKDGATTHVVMNEPVQLELQVLLDAQGVLREFAPLRKGNAMQSPSEVMLPSLRIMAKQELVRVLAQPVITSETGTIASIKMPIADRANYVQGIDVRMQSVGRNGSEVDVKWSAKMQIHGKDTPIEASSTTRIGQSESVLMRLHPAAGRYAEVAGNAPAVYLVITNSQL